MRHSAGSSSAGFLCDVLDGPVVEGKVGKFAHAATQLRRNVSFLSFAAPRYSGDTLRRIRREALRRADGFGEFGETLAEPRLVSPPTLRSWQNNSAMSLMSPTVPRCQT